MHEASHAVVGVQIGLEIDSLALLLTPRIVDGGTWPTSAEGVNVTDKGALMAAGQVGEKLAGLRMRLWLREGGAGSDVAVLRELAIHIDDALRAARALLEPRADDANAQRQGWRTLRCSDSAGLAQNRNAAADPPSPEPGTFQRQPGPPRVAKLASA